MLDRTNVVDFLSGLITFSKPVLKFHDFIMSSSRSSDLISIMSISEASISTNCRNIIIPCGKNKDNGCQLFTRTLEEIAAANLYSFRGTHGACRRQNAQSTSAPQSNVEPACYESNSC
ncbi:hypothetical protein BDE02_19G033700 [Populus trichocarpa]|nr:hypothetical protein BDE02_19G033700 [Populus trichocarpa]